MRAVPFLRLHPDARLPQQAHADDAGFDLHATEPACLAPGTRAAIGCGFAIALPAGMAALVVPRSGLALRDGLGVLNGPGLIDAGYRGEIKVILINLGSEAFVIQRGERIAQLVLAPVTRLAWSEVDALDETARGAGGFGSTGR